MSACNLKTLTIMVLTHQWSSWPPSTVAFSRSSSPLTHCISRKISMNTSVSKELEARANSLQRKNEFFLLNTLKPLQITIIHTFSMISLLPPQRKRKFSNYLGSSTWLKAMDTIRSNLFQSALLGDKVELSNGNQQVFPRSLPLKLLSIGFKLVEERNDMLRRKTDVSKTTS